MHIYCIAGMFGWVNVWRIGESKLVGEKKFGEWIDSPIMIVRYKKIWMALGESQTICQIRQTFPLPNIPAIQ